MPTDKSVENEAPARIWVELRTQHAFAVKPEPYIETVEYARVDPPAAPPVDAEKLVELAAQTAANAYGYVTHVACCKHGPDHIARGCEVAAERIRWTKERLIAAAVPDQNSD